MSFAELNYHIRPREGPIELHFLCPHPLEVGIWEDTKGGGRREAMHDKCKGTLPAMSAVKEVMSWSTFFKPQAKYSSWSLRFVLATCKYKTHECSVSFSTLPVSP